jgi:hypothetical protein
MRTLIFTLLLLIVPVMAGAQTWNESEPINVGPTDTTQTFTMDVSALGAPATRQDLTQCGTSPDVD